MESKFVLVLFVFTIGGMSFLICRYAVFGIIARGAILLVTTAIILGSIVNYLSAHDDQCPSTESYKGRSDWEIAAMDSVPCDN